MGKFTFVDRGWGGSLASECVAIMKKIRVFKVARECADWIIIFFPSHVECECGVQIVKSGIVILRRDDSHWKSSNLFVWVDPWIEDVVSKSLSLIWVPRIDSIRPLSSVSGLIVSLIQLRSNGVCRVNTIDFCGSFYCPSKHVFAFAL